MNPLFLLSGMGMMAIALVAVVYWKRRSKVASALFFWGALAWVAGNVLKSIAAIPMSTIIGNVRALLPRYFSEPLLWLYIGLLTGIFECGATLGFAHIRRIRTVNWREAVGFGLGFGAIEAFLLGAYSFLVILLIILIPDKLPPELLQLATSAKASLLDIPIPIVERLVVVLLHAFSCVLIIYAVRTREWKWFWISFFYKTALDAIAGSIQITYGVQNLTTLGAWIVEMILLPFGIVGFWGLRTFRRRW
ncbi:MAG: YhfC family intramembrane metalloprotease [Chloroflexi bacterium]|nr:YhfC family intramembrane metalloprotease [Chloroflexota bacterium]